MKKKELPNGIKIIDKLKLIRSAQIAYQSVKGEYTSDWDELINF